MKAPKIQQHLLLKKRDEIMAGTESSAASFKRLEWMRAFNNAIAFGNLVKYLQLSELRTADADLASIDVFAAYRKQFKQTVLHTMCFNDREAMLAYFIENKLVDLNELDSEGRPPLHVATMKSILTGITSIVSLLVEGGANILMKDSSGKTVYDYCLVQDPEEKLPSTILIADLYNKKHSEKLKETFFMIMHSEGRMNPPLCYLMDYDLYGVLDLL